jgi:hypothetical protein
METSALSAFEIFPFKPGQRTYSLYEIVQALCTERYKKRFRVAQTLHFCKSYISVTAEKISILNASGVCFLNLMGGQYSGL